jgi:hypothetical protein
MRGGPARNAWSASVKMPLEFSECYPDSVVVRDLVFGFFCGHAAPYETASGTWEEIHGGPLDEEVESEAYGRGIKLWRFAQLAYTDDTVVMLAEGITLEKTAEACYGCPGSPMPSGHTDLSCDCLLSAGTALRRGSHPGLGESFQWWVECNS